MFCVFLVCKLITEHDVLCPLKHIVVCIINETLETEPNCKKIYPLKKMLT